VRISRDAARLTAFLERWVVPAPIDRVYDAIGDVLGYSDR
jgi:hypothetical protein